MPSASALAAANAADVEKAGAKLTRAKPAGVGPVPVLTAAIGVSEQVAVAIARISVAAGRSMGRIREAKRVGTASGSVACAPDQKPSTASGHLNLYLFMNCEHD